jgi:two-component system chemotaxis response regulator CheB
MTDVIRVMVVDSSAYVRCRLTFILDKEADIRVVGMVPHGARALAMAQELQPHVILLALELNDGSGLTVLDDMMHTHPTPIVMICGGTHDAAMMALKAVHMGAVDFIQCDPGDEAMLGTLRWELTEKVRTASRIRVIRSLRLRKAPGAGSPVGIGTEPVVTASPVAAVETVAPPETVVVIGASTGGPTALRLLLGALPKCFPAGIIVVQHMPEGFTAVLAAQLDRYTAISVREAGHGTRLEMGAALVAPGDTHLLLRPGLCVQLTKEPPVGGHRPSIDVTMNSAAQICGARTQGVILTGMGADGAMGIKAIHAKGGKTFAQDAESCVVDGMPKRAREMGIIDYVDTPVQIARYLIATQP